jgi:multidrug efflux pump subunit AcrA (membrane-fusion protein)
MLNDKRSIKWFVWPLAALILLALGAMAYTANQNDDGHNHVAGNVKADEHAGHDHGQEKAEASSSHDEPAHADNPAASADEHGAAGNAEAAGSASHGPDDGHGHGAEAAHADEVTLTPEAIRKNGIRLEPARKQAMAESYTVPGRVSYNTEAMAHIGTPVEGRIAELKVKLGDMVKQGDVLLVIDSPALGEAQSAYLQKRTEVDVARSALDVSRTSAERAKRLYQGQGISLGEFQRREGEFKAAQGALRSAESAATAAENNLHLHGMTESELAQLVKTGEVNPRYRVRAPIGGRVVQREATLGEVVGPDREALLVLADMKILWVLADVPENRIHQVGLDAPASVTVESLGGKRYAGKVSYIAPELNHETRTAQVRVEFEDGESPVKPGMFAQVHLGLNQMVGQTQPETLAVPETAVQSFEGGSAVFVAVAGEPGTFAAKPIKAGPTHGKMIAVVSGLNEGEQVVVDGAFVIKAELAKGIMEGKTCSGH